MHTSYFIDLIMGNVFGSKTDPGLPSVFYVGLSTTEPAVDGSGVTEPSGASYARGAIEMFSVPSDGMVKNQSTVSFNESTENWGVITHYAVFDSITGGNLLFFDSLEEPRTIEADSLLVIKANEIELTLANKA